MDDKTITVLAVALITWGGVFAYLLRVHILAKALQEKMDKLNETSASRTESNR